MTSLTKRSSGFVLVGVIWVLAALSLLVMFIATQLETMQQQALSAESQIQNRLERQSIESVVLYLAATRTNTYAGMRTGIVEAPSSAVDLVRATPFVPVGDELRMDNSTYAARGGYQIQIQDAGSLVSLRSDRLHSLSRLLSDMGYDRTKVDRLISTLLDYVDRDDVTRLNGAERHEYISAGLVPPTNRFLASPLQLRNVIGWPEVLDDHPSLIDEVTIYVADRENFNTMTKRNLLTKGDISEVERLLQHRQTQSFSAISEVNRLTGRLQVGDPMSSTFLPSRYLRMRMFHADQAQRYELGVTLTPDSRHAPWEVDYRLAQNNSMDQIDGNDRALEPLAPPTNLLR